MKKLLHIYIRFVQKILITTLLTLVYFLIFSLTMLFVFIFLDKLLKNKKNQNSYWIDAEGYVADLSSATEQS